MLSYLESVKWFIRDHFKGVCSEPASQRHLHNHQLLITPKKIYIFPTYVFVTAFCKVTKQNKNKGKTQRVKTDVTSFALAPSPWKRQSGALYLGFKSACPFGPKQNNSTSRRIWMTWYILNILPNNRHGRWHRVRQAGFENRKLWLGRKKIIGQIRKS